MIMTSQNISCADTHCPTHSGLKVRGRSLVGKIVSAKMRRSATFELDRLKFMPKYQRYEKRRTRIKVHNPDCIAAVAGDKVRVKECRPLSKTKAFVIVEKLEAENATN